MGKDSPVLLHLAMKAYSRDMELFYSLREAQDGWDLKNLLPEFFVGCFFQYSFHPSSRHLDFLRGINVAKGL